MSLSKHFDAELLFERVDFTLNAGDRLGLVGPNGTGKSTLLRVLTGAERPTGGHVSMAPGKRLGYFAQQVPDPSLRVCELFRNPELDRVTGRLRELERQVATDPSVLDEYGVVQERWLALEGWTRRVARTRQRLDIAHLSDDAPLGRVSGGEQARLMLARVLLDEPDVLALDEPTNHLDADGIAWLGGYLRTFRGAVLVATHDRALLDRAVDRIVELDGIHTEPQWYEGGYTRYREEKGRRWQKLLLDHEAQEKFRRRLEADIATTKEQARGVEETTRSGPGADKLRRYAKKVAKKAKSRERRLTRQLTSTRWIAEPQTRPVLTLAFDGAPTAGEVVLAARRLTVRTLITDLDLEIRGGDRLWITGPNGSGKTTLLRALNREIPPDGGTVTGDATVAVLPQTHDDLRLDSTVRDFFRSRVPVYADEAEALLDAHLFGPSEWDRRLRFLSAGELRRLLLAVMVNSGADVLFLDEPTNYLDFEAIDVVEEALRAYKGTLVMVTHDAYFASNVTYTRTWSLASTRTDSA